MHYSKKKKAPELHLHFGTKPTDIVQYAHIHIKILRPGKYLDLFSSRCLRVICEVLRQCLFVIGNIDDYR